MFVLYGINMNGRMEWIATADEVSLRAHAESIRGEWAHVVIVPCIYWA